VKADALNDYRVAAYSSRRGRRVGELPEGKQHAYLDGARVTFCGFGLGEMRLFNQVRFGDQAPALRCAMCDRIVRAAAR
jgi:hypothetical protein